MRVNLTSFYLSSHIFQYALMNIALVVAILLDHEDNAPQECDELIDR